MSYISEMEWSAKWDSENLVAFGSKAIESPKKLQLAEWMIIDDEETDCGSFNLSCGGGNSGASGSDGGHGSSAKSSLSASTESSTKDGIQTPNFTFMTFEGSSGNFSDNMEMKGTEVYGTYPFFETSVGSAEPMIGLKLGKRTYFENSSGGCNVKGTSIFVMPTPSTTIRKKKKSSVDNTDVPRCQVEGCNVDLSMAKNYHKKHRVCDIHSKCPKVIVAGLERRFCQQCSRFHSLSDFDENKRSCRRRLSDHNARRRKPQQETIFNSTRLSSPFYGEKQQMRFLMNDAPFPANPPWNSTCNSKFTLTKGYPLKSNGDGGSKGSVISSSHFDAAPKCGRALSLLSSNSRGASRGQESTPVNNPLYENITSITQPMMDAVPGGEPLPFTEIWLTGQDSTRSPVRPLATSGNFQDIQLLKMPYETGFYTNIC